MKNFLERLAARPVEPPAVHPRVPGRFEQGPWADGALGNAGTADEPDRAEHPTASPGPASRESPPLAVEIGRRPALREHAPALVRPDAAQVTSAEGTESVMPSPRPVVREPPSPTRRSFRDPEATRTGSTTPAAATAPVARPLQSLRRALSPPTLPARITSDRPPPRATPDVVQVRIGRIEVRATIARPEHPAPAVPRPPRARPMSLEAFLDGKRGRR
jgi:hypothetical protein